MFKKAISWLLILALLCSCSWISVFADGETAEHDFMWSTADGSSTGYADFNQGTDTEDTSLRATNGVPAGGTVTLLRNVTLRKRIRLYENPIAVLDGNGFTISGASFDASSTDVAISMTIKNVTFDFTADKDNGYFTKFIQFSSSKQSITFENCTFDFKGEPTYAMFVPRGDLTLKNCSVKYTTTSAKPLFYNETNNYVKLINTTFDLSGAPNAMVGLGFGINNTYYTNMQTAMSKANVGDTLTLAADYKADGSGDAGRLFNFKDNLTIDGNGHTISANTNGWLIRADKSTTIRNLNVTQNGTGFTLQINSGSSVTIENSTIRCTGKTDLGTVVLRGELTLGNGAKIISDGAADNGSQSVGVRIDNANAALTVNEGAEITTVGNTFKADAATPTTITINGGTITTARHLWEANKAGCTLTINGGTIVGTHATDAMICLYASKTPTVNLLGGTFKAVKIMDTDNALSSLGNKISWYAPDGKVIFRAPNADEFKNNDADLLVPGGNMATKENSGIRFTTVIDKVWYDEMVAAGVTVKKTGTLIAPKKYVDRVNGEFTAEALKNLSFVDIENHGWYNQKTAEKENRYFYYGNLIELQPESITGELSGIGYMVVEVAGLGTFTLYGTQMNGIVKDIAASTTGNDEAQNAVLEFFRGNEG